MKYAFLIILSSLIVSCALTDTFDEVPMFISIEKADLETTALQGNNSSKIQDVWVFADGASIGVFELPATIPILSPDEEVKIDILAGIRNNGLALSPKQYPFMQTLTYNLDFEPEKVVPLEPVFSYYPTTNFALLENFEAELQFNLDLDDDPTSTIYRSEETPFGQFCGKIDVTEANTLFRQTTSAIYSVSDFGNSEVYLEIDYKCEVPFIVGYIGDNGASQVFDFFIVLNTTDDWNKLYLDLSSQLNGGRYDRYQILIAGVPQTEEGSIWVDNIKLLHFEN